MHYECSDSPNKRNAPPGGRPLDAQFASLAARQHGVVTVAQLVRAGLTRAAIAHRVKVGRLHRIHRGVYAVGHRRLFREGRWMAAVLAAGEGAALAGLSAAELWRITRWRTDLSVVIAPGQHRPQAGIRFLSYRRLDRRDITICNGIRVTTVARTQVDLTDVLTAHQLAYVIHEAGYRNRFNPRATRAAMERANGRHRLAVLDHALVLNALGSAGTRSDDEDRFLAIVQAAGLPEPLVSVKLGEHEVDFRWPGLCVEVDGNGHTRPRTRREDRRHDADLRAAGYATQRFTGDEVERHPTTVLARLRRALRPIPSPPSPAAVR